MGLEESRRDFFLVIFLTGLYNEFCCVVWDEVIGMARFPCNPGFSAKKGLPVLRNRISGELPKWS